MGLPAVLGVVRTAWCACASCSLPRASRARGDRVKLERWPKSEEYFLWEKRPPMQIGVRMSWEALEDKLEQRDSKRREATWQLNRLPKGLSDGPNYLFIAVGGSWVGYFRLADDILWNPDDERTPYSLIFDTSTWREIRPIEAKRFRGFTYDAPRPQDVESRE